MAKNAGYVIEKIEITGEKENECNGYVYAVHPSAKCPQRYVTWYFVKHFPKEEGQRPITDFYFGHYFERNTDALHDYYERIAEHYKTPF